ncbi:SET domain-containing protein [Obba rivulosa]|uniref:Histone-lysine N-methyltransferase, H3 lysine-36 specific n=1 Tax=Obba rivulosa TaxID=1052685 RepID=A0A8E2AZ35_9APHY|nr:SET domain-containing protein [Obba rivulosa]
MKLDGDERVVGTPPVSVRSKKPPRPEPQLIGHLPRAEEEAVRTFVEIESNHYQYGTLGRSREALESMTCDCQYEHGVDDEEVACGHSSDCINRLTQVECMPDDCRCRSYCQNQRFQRKEYADIEIVKTEKKGFGLRAGRDLRKDTFIYEYVGDVVSHPSFVKRMRQYAEEGIRHFYFMMLQKDEFIDATKRGGFGRFANHSCNPNCYVAKWTVGNHVRMGIFASRNIKKDEELTFNYNVDRYGHDAQPCYCGEPNCVGFIGGKTQTDLAAMDDLYLDALGISEEVESLGLKGSKKKKGRKLDEDYLPTLKPIILKDVPKVVQAMRQTQSRKVMFKLLTRIKMTEDQAALRQLMRLRGFSVMTNILEDYARDLEITTLAIECMMTWPLIQRNKVEDSKVDIPVQACAKSENEMLAGLAKKLLDQWETLEYAYRIPKRVKGDGEEEHWETVIVLAGDDAERPQKRRREDELLENVSLGIKPLGYRQSHVTPQSNYNVLTAEFPKPVVNYAPKKEDIAATIAAAQKAAMAAKLAAEQEAAAKAADERKAKEAKEARREQKHRKQSNEEKEANKEKRLLKLVGAVVVKCMSKYQRQMDHDTFKKHAKELTQVIAEKEKKSSSYKEGRLDALSDEKVNKIKKFAKEYITKVLRKMEKPGQRRKPSSGSGSVPTASTSTPDDADDADDTLIVTNLSVDDVMDLDDDYPDNGDGDDGTDRGSSEHDRRSEVPESRSHENGGHRSTERTRSTSASDPRRRHRNEECGWDPDHEKPGVLHGRGAVSVES